jgi:heme oxygenase
MHATPTERRALLRAATNDLHGELDVLASRLDLRHPVDYCRYLLATAGPIIGLEVALEDNRIEQVFSDWSRRRRRFALALDLHALGLTATPVEVSELWTRSGMLGAMYVLEGSRLGAQVLLRRVDESADQGVLAARHFLRGSEPTMWASYLRTLEDASPIDIDEMLTAARATFALFQAAFTRYCSPTRLAASSARSSRTFV